MASKKDDVDVIEIEPRDLMKGLIDVIRETEQQIGYYEIKQMTGNHLDNAIAATVAKEQKKRKKKLTLAQVHSLAAKLYTDIMMRWTLSAVSALSGYYSEVRTKRMSYDDLMAERHNSRRLARHLRAATGYKRPLNSSAHAIVSGNAKYEQAEAAREILAGFGIRIDDPANGVFLPKSSKHIGHPRMPEAVNHSEIHTRKYYVNVLAMLSQTTSAADCRRVLGLIAKQLRDGTFKYK